MYADNIGRLNLSPLCFTDLTGNTNIDNPGVFLTPVGEASVAPATGGLRLSQPLDFDQSPGTAVGGSPALVYNSDTVSVRPIVQANLWVPPSQGVPSSIQVQLTWDDGTPQPWVTFSTAGHNPGDDYLLAAQVANPVAATGRYSYTLAFKATFGSTTYETSFTDSMQVVVNDNPSTPFGAGWSIDGLDHIVPVSGGALYIDGQGDSRLFTGTGHTYSPLTGDQYAGYISPPDDFGTLTRNGDGTYTYVAKDKTKKNFDASGRLTSAVDTHGIAITYAYDANGHLSTVTAPDGGVTTFTYDANGHLASIAEPGGRTFSTTISAGGNLTGLTDIDGTTRSFTYDAGHRLTNDTWAPLNATFTYDAATGRLTGVNRGLGGVYTLARQQLRGLAAVAPLASA